MAIVRALEEVPRDRTIVVHSDSSYALGPARQGLEGEGQPGARRAHARARPRFRDLRLVKVDGHAGVAENERADELARTAIVKRALMRPELVLVGVTILWGSTFIVTKDIVRDAPPMLYLVFRFGIAALLILRALLAALRRGGAAPLIVDGVVLGVLNSLGLVLQVIGQVFTTASKSAFITSLNTPLVPLVAFVVYRTRPSPPQLVAVVLATVGLMLLTYPVGGARWNAGDLYTVGCAIFYAFTIVQIARRSPRHDARPLTAVQIVDGDADLLLCARTSEIVHPHHTAGVAAGVRAARGAAARRRHAARRRDAVHGGRLHRRRRSACRPGRWRACRRRTRRSCSRSSRCSRRSWRSAGKARRSGRARAARPARRSS